MWPKEDDRKSIWIWPKPTNHIWLNLTETDNEERALVEHDQKRLSLTEN